MNNTRVNRLVTVNGVTRSLAEWSRVVGLDQDTIRVRLKYKWTPEDAVLLPLGARGHNRWTP